MYNAYYGRYKKKKITASPGSWHGMFGRIYYTHRNCRQRLSLYDGFVHVAVLLYIGSFSVVIVFSYRGHGSTALWRKCLARGSHRRIGSCL